MRIADEDLRSRHVGTLVSNRFSHGACVNKKERCSSKRMGWTKKGW